MRAAVPTRERLRSRRRQARAQRDCAPRALRARRARMARPGAGARGGRASTRTGPGTQLWNARRASGSAAWRPPRAPAHPAAALARARAPRRGRVTERVVAARRRTPVGGAAAGVQLHVRRATRRAAPRHLERAHARATTAPTSSTALPRCARRRIHADSPALRSVTPAGIRRGVARPSLGDLTRRSSSIGPRSACTAATALAGARGPPRRSRGARRSRGGLPRAAAPGAASALEAYERGALVTSARERLGALVGGGSRNSRAARARSGDSLGAALDHRAPGPRLRAPRASTIGGHEARAVATLGA
jgi:hypothetical protein